MIDRSKYDDIENYYLNYPTMPGDHSMESITGSEFTRKGKENPKEPSKLKSDYRPNTNYNYEDPYYRR